MNLRTDLANLVINRALAGAAVVAVLAGGTAVLTDRGTATTERPATPAASDVEPALPSAPPATVGTTLPPTSRAGGEGVDRATEPSGPPDPVVALGDAGSDPSESNPSDPPRSDVADRVHLALAGGLQPGDVGFGQAVAERARADGAGLGADVSAAARAAGDEADSAPGTDAAVSESTGSSAGTDSPRSDTDGPGAASDARGAAPRAAAVAADGPGRAGKPKGDGP